jgi:hypothetical protein
MKPQQIQNNQPVPMITWFRWLGSLVLACLTTYWYAIAGRHLAEDITNMFVYAGDAHGKTSSLATVVSCVLWAILLGTCFCIVARIIYLVKGPDSTGPVMNG